ncbi:MAG TPA: SDR family oxidoreductase [Marmoricola sp.]|nr:SDR family oxidoreductase [Marmoricola sp.]
MRIVIAGGHGQVARHLGRVLVAAGHEPVGMVRKDEHEKDLRGDGVEPVRIDLENTDVEEMTSVVRGADAVVFAAGGGPDGNAARKETVDKGAAIMLAEAAQAAGVRRYVMVSSMGTEHADPGSEDVFQVYLRAKKAADDHVRATDLDWTIVRPGRLTDDPPTGRVRLGDLPRGEVTRADVAQVLAAVLEADNTVGQTFDLLNGDVPVVDAVAAV